MPHSRCSRTQCGMTLLELMVTLAISSVLLAVSIPALSDIGASLKVRADKQNLVALINSARQHAITSNQFVAICHLKDNVCDGANSKLTMFVDTNDNRQLDIDEQQLETLEIDIGPSLSWNKTTRIRFDNQGHALNGTLQYCQGNKEQLTGFQIIISRPGRIRFSDKLDKCAEPLI